MKQVLFILFLFVQTYTYGQLQISVGKQSPQITITDWISNIPKDTSLENKFIVLEFWATWCGPCIAAVPHMNSLQSKFKMPNLYFISITDESREKVERILKRIEFNSIVVSDQSNSTHIKFGDGKEGLKNIPLTVLIDNKGIVSWIGHPQNLSESIIADFIKGKKIIENEVKSDLASLNPSINQRDKDEDDLMSLITNRNILFKLEFKKSINENYQITKVEPTLYSYTYITLLDLYSDLFGQDRNSIIMPDKLKNEKFDLVYKNNSGDKNDLLEVEKYILKSLGLKKSKSMQKVLVHEVSISNSQLLDIALDLNSSSRSNAHDKIIFSTYTIRNLFRDLNSYSIGIFSFPEAFDGKFDFIIGIKNTEDVINSLESYGFKITSIEKEVEFLELTKGK